MAWATGLDRKETLRALTERRHRQQVHAEAARAQRLGATGAPFIVVNGRYGIPGAQDSDAFLVVLRTAWAESHPEAMASAGEAPVCGPDGCAVPAAG
ncbi:DsbA family oxidoreductase [Streptomyces bluensis]|uniref:DsbA family oxidoreductase n=1 Tax=Streptomyces bluensis TaxID=33897 RepID=UPI003333AFFB